MERGGGVVVVVVVVQTVQSSPYIKLLAKLCD